MLCWDKNIEDNILEKNNTILRIQYPYAILGNTGHSVLLQCTSEATYHYKKLIDGYLGQGLMDEISYMRGTFSDQSLKFSAKIQKEWNEEEKKLAE